MDASLRTRTVHFDGITVLIVKGDIDITTCRRFDDALERAVVSSRAEVWIDLSNCSHFGSEAARSLERARQHGDQRGTKVTIVSAKPMIRRVLDITKSTVPLR